MSRIDEALKRVGHGLPGRRGSRGAEAPLRLADELTLEQYPLEYPIVANRPESPAKRVEVTPLAARQTVKSSVSPLVLDANTKVIIGAHRDDVTLEQYRRLAATLQEGQNERGLKTVMVTSAIPREGKTLTAVNLALTLSESYERRVLLVDADLRHPSIHGVLGIPNRKGLSEMLREGPAASAIVEVLPRLSVLTSGHLEQNPQAGLSSEYMRALIEDAARSFDWVILDTPPVGLVSDGQIVSRLAQAVIMVVRAASTPSALVEKAVAELGRDSIVGVVLNGVDEKVIPETGYYGDYYRSRSTS